MAEMEEYNAKRAIIRLEDIVKFYGENEVVKKLNLDIYESEFLTLLGPSGCGKTTTLRMIAGFEDATEGKIYIEEKDMEGKPPYLRNVNTVFQSYALFPHMNVYNNVAFGLVEKKMKKAEIKEKVTQALALVQLTGFEKRMPTQISGGQKQRVAIARAIVNNPKVLLLDEPLGALDLKLRKQMQLELKHLQKQLGITFIYVTHDQEEALTMSDRIAVMNAGVMEQIGSSKEIYEKPRTKFVADFIGESNIFEAYINNLKGDEFDLILEYGKIHTRGGSFVNEEMVYVCVRPENLRCAADPVENYELCGIVKEHVYIGAQIKTTVELANGQIVKLTNHPEADLPELGSLVYLYWKEDKAVIMHTREDKLYDIIEEAEPLQK
jgi:spermidine/putrescine transport system ATP-binding protein